MYQAWTLFSPLQFLKQQVFNYYYYYTLYLFKGEFQTKILRHRLVSNSEVKFGTFMWGATGEQVYSNHGIDLPGGFTLF